jgi:hypothetical protein
VNYNIELERNNVTIAEFFSYIKASALKKALTSTLTKMYSKTLLTPMNSATM